jgi:mannan endo-1,4-beta-mannosidase
VLIQIAANGLPEGYFTEAEAFTAQTGGDIHIRDDKPGVHGKAISHWDDKGHSLTWEVSVPADGNYVFVACYCNPNGARRRLTIDGRDIGVFTFAGSGGFGETPYEWTLFTVNRDNGKPFVLPLKAGKHVIQLENTDGKGTNLDYLGFIPAK